MMIRLISLPMVLIRSILIICLFIMMLVMQVFWRMFGGKPSDWASGWFHTIFLRITGVRVLCEGIIHRRYCLFVSNHCSWLDIPVLGSLLSDASFVSKDDVRKWPFVGPSCWWQRTVFVNRKAFLRAGEQRDILLSVLRTGRSLILFPEGTTNDGNRVLPFKSSLFAAADGSVIDNLVVQPVSIVYSTLDGNPMGRFFRPLYAWYGDMDFLFHLFVLLGLGRCVVRVSFHQPIEPTAFASRKDLARHCYSVCAQAVAVGLYERSIDSG